MWNILETDFGDETANFGPRRETGTALFQLDTISTVSCPDNGNTVLPQTVSSVLGDLTALAVDKSLILQSSSILGFDYEIEEMEWSPDGSLIIVGVSEGILYVLDAQSLDIIFSLNFVPEERRVNGRSFRKILFAGTGELVILTADGQLIVQRDMEVYKTGEGNLAEAIKEKICMGSTTDQHRTVYDLVIRGDCIYTLGAGDCILGKWSFSQGSIQLEDALESSLFSDVYFQRGTGTTDGHFLFLLDSNHHLSIWDTETLVCIRHFTDLVVSDLCLLETNTSQNNSLQDMKLVLTQPVNGQCHLNVHCLPSMETVYTLQLSDHSQLAKCNTFQDSVYITEFPKNESKPDIITTARFRCLTETDPKTRLYRILQKNKFEEAEKFANVYQLDIELVHKVKSNYLINELSPWNVCKYEPEQARDMVVQLLHCLKTVVDDLHTAETCMTAALPTYTDTENMLNYCKSRLDKAAASKDPDVKDRFQMLSAKLLDIQHKLLTFKLAFGEISYTGEKWQRFMAANLLHEALRWMDSGHLDTCFIIWTRHQAEWTSEALSVELIGQVLSTVPYDTPPTTMLGYISTGLIPLVMREVPEALDVIVTYAVEKTKNMEHADKVNWPTSAISFAEFLYDRLHEATTVVMDRETCMASDNTNKTRLKCDTTLEPLHTLILKLKQLDDILHKYKCKLALEQFLKETKETIAFRMLDKVVALELIAPTLERQIRPYMKEHSLNQDQIFSKYIKDLLERHGQVQSYTGKVFWEAKASAVIDCITDPEQKLEGVLEVMKWAPIPWSSEVEQLVNMGLKINHNKVARLKEQCHRVNVRKLMMKYGMKNVDLPSGSDAMRLVYFMLTKDKSGCVEDGLEILRLCGRDSAKSELYDFRMRQLIADERIEESLELLRSLSITLGLKIAEHTVIYSKVLLNFGCNIFGLEEKEHRDKQLFTEAAIHFCKYLQTNSQDHLDVKDWKEEEKLLIRILALQVEYDMYLTLVDYQHVDYRMRVIYGYMKEFFAAKTQVLKSSYAKLYRLADLLQINHATIQGQMAIKCANAGDINTAVGICGELYESSPTQETANTLYTVVQAFLGLQAEVKAEDMDVDTNKLRLLPEVCYRLASQALCICEPDKLCQYLELSKVCSLLLSVSQQCESGDSTLSAQWGESETFCIDKAHELYGELSLDVFQEDALLLSSVVALPLVSQYALHNPLVPASQDLPTEDKEEDQGEGSPAGSLCNSVIPVVQHLRDSGHLQIAFSFSLHMLYTLIYHTQQQDMGLPIYLEERIMPRKKNWRRSEARSCLWGRRSMLDGGFRSDVGLTNPMPLADYSAMPSGQVCLAKDEGLTTPASPQGLVSLVDLSTKPSALQGCMKSDGGKARPTCLSYTEIDRLVHSCDTVSAVPSEHMRLELGNELEFGNELDTELGNELDTELGNELDTELGNEHELEHEHDFENEDFTNTALDIGNDHCFDTSVKHGLDLGNDYCIDTKLRDEQICSDFENEQSLSMKENSGNEQPLNEHEQTLNCLEQNCKKYSSRTSRTSLTNSELNISSKIQCFFPEGKGTVTQSHSYNATPIEDCTVNMHFKTVNPYHMSTFIMGSFNQADKRFAAESRGSQCTVISLCSLIYANYSTLGSKRDLDTVLVDGDMIYNQVLLNLKSNNSFHSKLLNFDELPTKITLLNLDIAIKKENVVSGVCTQNFSTSELPSLYQSLYTVFQKSSQFLLMIGSVCSAVFHTGDEYFIFDSHSHGLDGLSCPDGKSVLVSFHSLEDLVTFMYAMYASMLIDISEQFDILPLHFTTHTTIEGISNNGTVKVNSVRSISNSDVITVQNTVTNEWKTVTKSRKRKSTHAERRRLKSNAMTEFPLQQGSSKTKCVNEHNSVTLIGRYFKDQHLKQKTKRHKLKGANDRKEYLRLYKQMQRQSPGFRRVESDAKKVCRQLPENKNKERKYKTTARESEEFKLKERENKRAYRKLPGITEVERQRTKRTKTTARESEEFKVKERKDKSTYRKLPGISDLEKERTMMSMKTARESDEFKVKEREGKQNYRKLPGIRNKEKERTMQSMSTARESDEFKLKEREGKQNYRKLPGIRNKEKERTMQSMTTARESDQFKMKEREAKSTYRKLPGVTEIERQRTKHSKTTARKSEEFKRKERDSKRTYRNIPESKKIEKARTLQSMNTARQSDKFRQNEKENKRKARLVEQHKQRELEKKRRTRQSSEYRRLENESSRSSKRKARSDPHYVEKERLSKQNWRSNVRNKELESARSKASKATNRQNAVFVDQEKSNSNLRKYGKDIDSCIDNFHRSISFGPVFICSCCDQTWFRQSVSETKSLTEEQKAMFLGPALPQNKQWICCTCKNSIVNHKIPKLSVVNGMHWPSKPSQLDLYPLEERLIALRIPFMQIRELPRGRQLSVKGNVVNVPVDIQPVVNALPRPLDENITVAVKLKKKMSFKTCAFSENVRPLRVLVALHWLMQNSDMYKNANVDIDEEWINRVTENSNDILNEFVSNSKTSSNAENTMENLQVTDSSNVELYDSDTEEVVNENIGNIDTLLDDANIENRTSCFTFAPGEGQRPLSLYQDKDSEYLCFPSIYCGQQRLDNEDRQVSVHYSDIAKWELRSKDRRAANSVPNIFFKLKKIQMKQLNDKVNLAVRRCQGDTQNMTVAQAKDSNAVNKMIKQDEGYYIFKQLRNSPAYLENRKKDVFAMIRQLGLPTWFMSLSSADTRWCDLLKMLAKLNLDQDHTDEQIKSLSWEEKIKLIQKDPVTCSRYFDHRVQEFIKLVLKSDHEPLGTVTDFFYRVEFQQRGSPHIHMIVWIKDAPQFNSSSNEDIIAFVDHHLQCSHDDDDDEMKLLTELQIHKHSRTCHKKEDKLCRFGYPLPPLPSSMVLDPLEMDNDKYSKQYKQLQKKMNDQKNGYDMTFEQFLKTVAQMSEDDYLKCIRSSLSASKVFLKRTPKQIRVNLYNPNVLKAWRANIDIQFVLDPYACAMYIVSYISKSQRGMSNLMHAAAKEAKNGNMDIKKQVRHIGNVFCNSVEVGAQEAVYLILQMPLTKATRDVVFINTSVETQRIQLLKPMSLLEEMPDTSTDIMSDNVIKRYSKRPQALSNWCLADYVSQLDIVYPEKKENHDEDNNDDDSDTELNNVNFDADEIVLTLRNGMKIRRRKKSKIIRYVRFNKKTDEENHYREKLLLFHPWRDENIDLLCNHDTYKDSFLNMKSMIEKKCREYEHHADELELARDMAETDYDAFDEIAPSTQQIEGDTAEEETVDSESFIYFNPDRVTEHRQYDIGNDIGCYVSAPQISTNDNILSDEDYRKLLRSLNSKQRHFYNHVIHWIKSKDEPLFAFLSGGAGVGKSVVIRALYQTLYRILNLKQGEDVDEICVLLCAFTGKAAFNINGSTISSAFKQKFKQSDQTLTCDNLNSFRSKYRNLSMVIIDEISMVSNSMLSFIDQRLQELKGTRKPFGGVSIVVVGDLYQLKPVSGNWIFNDLMHGTAALSANLWQDHFQMFQLTEIMRQKDDMEFAELLNRLRKNILTNDDMAKLKGCTIGTSSPAYDKTSPHLFAENFFMHLFNDSIITSSSSEKAVVPCHDTVLSPKLSKEKQLIAIAKLPTDPSKTANLHCSLTMVVDMIYDLTVNINTEDGLANGASCIIKYIEYKQQETNRPSITWVLFDDAKSGSETRQKYLSRGLYSGNINTAWTPIFDIERSFIYNRKTFQRIQFPLQPSAGRSVHRAQGSTLDKVVIDLSQRKVRKVPHLHYVALSRVRSIKKLQILNFNELALTVDDQVDREMARLQAAAMMKLCFEPLDSFDCRTHFKVIFNNCRSFHRHFDDVKADQNAMSSHILALAESRLCPSDEDQRYTIDGFQLIRNDQSDSSRHIRPSHGLVVYVRNDVHVQQCVTYSDIKLEFIYLKVNINLHQKQIVIVYKAPSMSLTLFKATFNEHLCKLLELSMDLIIVGDFNTNVSDPNNGLCTWLEQKIGCKQQIHTATTDYGSILDLIFTNTDGISGVVETYWSDHKFIYFANHVNQQPTS